MKKLVYWELMMFLLVLMVYFISSTTTLAPKEVAFVTFLAMAGTLLLLLIWERSAAMWLPALVASLATLMALAHLSGLGWVVQLAFPALVVVVAIWTAVHLNLKPWKVLFSVLLLTGAIYLPLVGFHFNSW